jgi:anti-sigma B factor antagonist
MEVNIRTEQGASLAQLVGDLDGVTAPIAQEKILPLVAPGARIILEMSQVEYMSSAGLRMLLALYRSIAGRGGKVVLVGLSSDLEDTMSLTGFLDFFQRFATLEEGLAALQG